MDENTPPNAPATKLSPLYNTKFARESCLTQEHFCFVAYHDTKGTASPDLLKLLNDTFSLEQDMTDLEQAITYVHTNVKREEKLLLRANIYPWSSPLPPPAWPSRVTSYSVSNYESIYTDEVKAFMVWKYYLGFNKHQILDSLNRLFRTDHSSTALKSAMTILFKNEGTIARLRKDAQQYDWWKPPPPEDSIDGRRVARADRLREAKKRMTEKALVQKQAWKTQERADSEQWNLPQYSSRNTGIMRSPKDASSGSYSHPIKIEDSDSDDGGLRDNGLAYFSSIANTLEKSPSTQSSTNRFQPSPSQRSKSPDNSHLKEQPNFSQGSEMYEPDEENLKVSPRARYTDRRAGTGGPD